MKRFALLVMALLLTLTLSSCGGNKEFNFFDMFHDGLLAVEKDGSWGYINKKGEVKIEFTFDSASAFFDGTALVKDNDKYFVINTKGDEVLDKKYDKLTRMTKDILRYKENDKYGLMTMKGKELTDEMYDEIGDFEDGLAKVKLDDKWGYINEKGDVKIDIEYKYAYTFSEGLAAVKNEDGKYGYINTKGKEEIEFKYTGAERFNVNGLTVVQDSSEENSDFLINTKGKVILQAYSIGGSGPLYRVQEGKDDVEKVLYDEDGDLFVDTKFDSIWSVREYMVNVSTDGNDDIYIMYNSKGEEIRRIDFDLATVDYLPTIEKYVVAEEDGNYIDVYYDGDEFRFNADDIEMVTTEGTFILIKNDKYGIVDKKDTELVEFVHDLLVEFTDGYFMFEADGKYGFMDSNFEEITEAIYDNIAPFPNPGGF